MTSQNWVSVAQASRQCRTSHLAKVSLLLTAFQLSLEVTREKLPKLVKNLVNSGRGCSLIIAAFGGRKQERCEFEAHKLCIQNKLHKIIVGLIKCITAHNNLNNKVNYFEHLFL